MGHRGPSFRTPIPAPNGIGVRSLPNELQSVGSSASQKRRLAKLIRAGRDYKRRTTELNPSRAPVAHPPRIYEFLGGVKLGRIARPERRGGVDTPSSWVGVDLGIRIAGSLMAEIRITDYAWYRHPP